MGAERFKIRYNPRHETTLNGRVCLLIVVYPAYTEKMPENLPDEQRLLWNLLLDYDPAARPVYNASHTVTVMFGYTLTQIADMVRNNVKLHSFFNYLLKMFIVHNPTTVA